METKVEELYGLKIGDKVKYIGNEEKYYNKIFFNKEGVVTKIIPPTGEFHVKFPDVQYEVSFQRNDLLLLDGNENKEVDFEGQLTEVNELSLPEMRSYLKKYHDLQEGKDFSLTDRDGKKEVMLTNEKYVTVLKDLFSLEKVSKELADKSLNDFKHTMLPEINENCSVSLTFKIANWTFRTHLTPWSIQYALLAQYGLDLYDEWGIKKS